MKYNYIPSNLETDKVFLIKGLSKLDKAASH